MRKIFIGIGVLAVSVSCLMVIQGNEWTSHSIPTDAGRQGKQKFDGPAEFFRMHREMRTPDDAFRPMYHPAYLMKEYQKARLRNQAMRTDASVVLEWKERGPNNVPGRTRGLIVDPDDASKNTWYAGSVSGGAWKTTDGGQTWTHLTEGLPNLAMSVLVMAASNREIIYAGTGEGFGNLDGVSGNGIFKSSNRGKSWAWLSSSADIGDVNRMIVSPTDANVVVAATTKGIYRTTNGGSSWTLVSDRKNVQDLNAVADNFQIQYAAQYGFGVIKSVDGGINWGPSNTDLVASGRVEIDVSPLNGNVVYAAAQSSLTESGSVLYRSEDGAQTWKIIGVTYNGELFNFLSDQGWYDNVVTCDPLNQNTVYVGGVNFFRIQTTSGSTKRPVRSLEQDNTDQFLSLVNFTGATNGNYTVSSFAGFNSIEVRFGATKSQKAHRFLTPVGATSGVADANYSYADYVQIPFEVWDITRNKQLMVSFRDQDRNGLFNLLPENTTGESTVQAREYVYISDVDYNATSPDAQMAVAGGHKFREMLFFWPVLAANKSWPGSVVESKLKFLSRDVSVLNATTAVVSDAYSNYGGLNKFSVFGRDMHPDQHNLVPIAGTASTFRLLAANDGGIFLSNLSATPGVNEGDWSMRGTGFRTTQFYGADKRPGFEEFFGGTQDNGTWKTPDGVVSSSGTNYDFEIGGDGFEVIWHQTDGKKLIGGSQGNRFVRSVDGGNSWTDATSGLSGTHPFVSKLANSDKLPDRIYTLSSAGVFRSENFGQTWTLSPIAERFGSGSLMDVEVSRANENIVWAGTGMSTTGTLRNLFISEDLGVTFNAVNNYDKVVMGNISRLASHPTEPGTAYALFSFSGRPKILRTKNKGASWEDISGFESNPAGNRGFPDVATYTLLVHSKNPKLLWAGTEIGIVESTDEGLTWNLREDFPAVSVWELKERENLIVIATHGRGIWTAATDRYQQTISFGNPGSRDETVGSFDLNGKSTSGLSLTYSTVDGDKISISGNKVTILKPGQVTIQANQGGSEIFKEAASVSQTFCINPKKPVITATGLEGTNVVLKSDYASSIEWYRNSNPLTGENKQEFSPTLEGNYQVAYSVGTCKTFSDVFPVIVTALMKDSPDHLTLYPNPATEWVTLRLPTAWCGGSVALEIFKMTGEKVLSRTHFSDAPIDVSMLSKGGYILRVRKDKAWLESRLIK
ncbi:MAG: T9SS type A sorting domain-containing protein [Bacteroidetes bacterium]|nr:T9SS type A sorting domain-containing protein [Bacteroidota bacterium]